MSKTKLFWNLRFILHFWDSPNSPEGRKLRIERLILSGVEESHAKATVYTRDLERGYKLSKEEMQEVDRLLGR